MKILFLTPGCFDKGGISRYSRYQIEALRQIFGSGNVKVLSLLGKNSDSFEEDFFVDWNAGGSSFYKKIRFVLKLFFETIFWSPDYIHVAHVNFSGVAYIISKFKNAKVILNVYGLEVWSGFSFDAKLGLKKAFKIISDCHYTKNYLINERLREDKDISVIWDCVNLNHFSPAQSSALVIEKYKLPDPQKFKIILTLGRLSSYARHKGYENLIITFSKLAQLYNDIYLVVAGDGDFRQNLEQLVKEKGIKDKVVFTGSIDEADLPDIYRCAYLFSLISDRGIGRGEGIPLTPLEAMACGVPIIVGNHDGSQEAIIDNNGVVVDPLDLNSHLKLFKRLIEDNLYYLQLKANTLTVSEVYFSFGTFKEKNEKFYNSLVVA